MLKTLTCKNCKITCCDEFELIRRPLWGKTRKVIKGEGNDYHKDIEIIDPKKFKIGTLVELDGITIVKKKNGRWICRAFDPIKRECKIYDYRPYMCRQFICRYHAGSKRNKIEHIRNRETYIYVQDKEPYTLSLTVAYNKIEKECGKEFTTINKCTQRHLECERKKLDKR